MPVTIPGIENLSPAAKYVIAFAIIFVLLALFALILRRLTGGRMSMSNERGRARQPRLGIIDVYDLDRQRQLILLRRDNVEHLLLVGGPNDVVVETNIVRVPGARLPTQPSAEVDAGLERNVEIAPVRPVVEGGLPRPAGRTGDNVVVAHLGPAEAVVAEPALKPTQVTPAPQPQRPAPSRGGQQPNGGDRSGTLDMTQQLEAALRGPPVTPAPPPRPAPEPARVPVPVPSPRPAAEQPRPRAEPQPQPQPQPQPRPAPSPTPAPRAAPQPQPARPEQAGPKPPAPQPGPPPTQAQPNPPPPKSDPFSIEDIEAEFARLLGRPLDKKE